MTLWTPAYITDGSLDLWFDASNAPSVSLTGSSVNSWTDLAHSVVVSAINGNPVYTANVQNGLPAIDIGTVNTDTIRLQNTSTSFANFSNPMSLFVVLNLARQWAPTITCRSSAPMLAPPSGQARRKPYGRPAQKSWAYSTRLAAGRLARRRSQITGLVLAFPAVRGGLLMRSSMEWREAPSQCRLAIAIPNRH
jgi:hypothetical protein